MRKINKIITLALLFILVLSCFSATACSKTGTKEGELRITYFNGGFGDKWLKTVADDFVAAKAAEGVKISYKLEPKGSGLSDDIKTYLTSDRNLSDVYMTQSISWKGYVFNGGKLADLTSVYESEVERLDGTKIKVKDFLLDEVERQAYVRPVRGNTQVPEIPFMMPWSLLETSIIYNEDILKATPKSGTNGNWTEPPATMVELAAFCNDINAESAKNSNAYGKKVAPFAWGYGGINHFESVIDVIWAQQQGVYESRISGEGSYYDFWNCESPDVWKQTGIQNAIDEWRKIIVNEGSGTWKNSIDYVATTSFEKAALAFADKEAAMVLSGSFFENEQIKLLDANGDGKSDINIKMMSIPYSTNNLKNDDGSDANINLCNLSDMMLVPEQALNKELAKEFLAFMCNERYLLDFTKETGCVRPFKYDPVELTKEDQTVQWSDFFMSCYNMRENADYNIFHYPVKAAQNGTVSDYYIYKSPELFMTGVTVLHDLPKLTGAQLMVTGLNGDGRGSVYTEAFKDWNAWKSDLGL